MAAPQKKRRRKAASSAPPEPPARYMMFGHPIKFGTIAWAVSTATVFLVAIITYNTAHPLIEPGFPAVRGYVREHAQETVTKTVKPIDERLVTWEKDYGAWRAIQSAATERNTLVNLDQNLASAQKELKDCPQCASIKERVQELENQIKRTKSRIQDYEAAALKK